MINSLLFTKSEESYQGLRRRVNDRIERLKLKYGTDSVIVKKLEHELSIVTRICEKVEQGMKKLRIYKQRVTTEDLSNLCYLFS